MDKTQGQRAHSPARGAFCLGRKIELETYLFREEKMKGPHCPPRISRKLFTQSAATDSIIFGLTWNRKPNV